MVSGATGSSAHGRRGIQNHPFATRRQGGGKNRRVRRLKSNDFPDSVAANSLAEELVAGGIAALKVGG
nr:hypothetical protein JVH1_8729 [Rhodococcus sp. JVH1]